MPLRPKSKIYEDAVELAEALFRSGGVGEKAPLDRLIELIFKGLKKINEEEEYPKYK